jgi:hypothetical protein
MAGDVRSSAAVEAPGAAPPAPLTTTTSRSERARSSVYRLRFALVYVVLAAIVGAGVGAFVVLVTRPDAAPAADWSSWKPAEDASADARAKQIADHVSSAYRLPSGNQLAVAIVGPPQFSAAEQGSIEVSTVAIRPDTSRGQAEESDIEIHSASNTLMVQLCGLGERCSIGEGEPSEERHELLRREALELSLYAFKYVDGIDSAIVFLPPRPDAEVGTSVYLRKGDVGEALRHPLRETLTAATTPPLGQIDPDEQATVDRLTRDRVYQFGVTQAQDGSLILVLDPVAA